MAADVMKITAARKSERSEHSESMRQTLALEQIADALEALRFDMQGIALALRRVADRAGRSDD